MLDLGFDTIGNATVIAYDRGPVLVTDPWLDGAAYFGSWALSHDVPDEQRAAALACPFVWISHGHPDHLHAESLRALHGKRVLLPDHVGGRIATALRADGHDVTVLADRVWTSLSDRIRVLSIADYNQDAVLLIDIGGTLVIDLNDATDHGWRGAVRRIVREYDDSYLLALSGFGDADMINVFDESGRRIPPYAAKRRPVGASIGLMLDDFGARHFIPFSSMHRYHRTDSAWANEYTTGLDDYATGFASQQGDLLPAFVRVDVLRHVVEELSPAENTSPQREPGDFGDDWSDALTRDDVAAATRYFQSIAHLGRHFSAINLRIGGEEHTVPLGRGRARRALTFEAPRHSFMNAIRYEVFDDMLIGNFMKTTLHGTDDPNALYPDFTPYVGKYADNGNARTRAELGRYFARYAQRDPIGYLRQRFERRSIDTFRRLVPDNSRSYRSVRDAYHRVVAGRHR